MFSVSLFRLGYQSERTGKANGARTRKHMKRIVMQAALQWDSSLALPDWVEQVSSPQNRSPCQWWMLTVNCFQSHFSHSLSFVSQFGNSKMMQAASHPISFWNSEQSTPKWKVANTWEKFSVALSPQLRGKIHWFKVSARAKRTKGIAETHNHWYADPKVFTWRSRRRCQCQRSQPTGTLRLCLPDPRQTGRCVIRYVLLSSTVWQKIPPGDHLQSPATANLLIAFSLPQYQ